MSFNVQTTCNYPFGICTNDFNDNDDNLVSDFFIYHVLIFIISPFEDYFAQKHRDDTFTVVPYGSSFCEASNHASTWKSFHTGHKQERHLPSVWPRCGL